MGGYRRFINVRLRPAIQGSIDTAGRIISILSKPSPYVPFPSQHERCFYKLIVIVQRTNAMRSEKLILVEQVGEHALELLLVENRQHAPPFIADVAVMPADHQNGGLRWANQNRSMSLPEGRTEVARASRP